MPFKLRTSKSLKEAYQPVTGKTTAEKTAAEKTYKDELKNKTLDLANFHIAYDDIIAAANMFGVFDDKGTLVNRATYGQIKNCADQKAMKVLKALWVAIYSDFIKTAEYKKAAEEEQKRREEEAEKQRQEKAANDAKLDAEHLAIAEANVQSIKAEVLAAAKQKEPRLFEEFEWATDSKFSEDNFTVTFRGTDATWEESVPRATSTKSRYSFDRVKKSGRILAGHLHLVLNGKESDTTMPIRVGHTNFEIDTKDTADALVILMSSLNAVLRQAYVSKLLETTLYARPENELGGSYTKYYVRDDGIYRVGLNGDGKFEIINLTAKNYRDIITDFKNIPLSDFPSFEGNNARFLAAKCNLSYRTGRCYVSRRDALYYNHVISKQEADAIGAQCLDYNGGNGETSSKITHKVPPELKKYGFDTAELQHYECDSGD